VLVAVRRGLLFVAAAVVLAAATCASAAPARRSLERRVAPASAGSLLLTGGPGGGNGGEGSVYAVDSAGGPLKELVPGPVEGAQWSPDGRRLAFIRLPADCAACSLSSELEVTNADGSADRSLVVLPSSFVQFAWSPDSRRIAYAYCPFPVGSLCGIHVIAGEGGGDRLLARSLTSAFSWSPDGTKLAFIRDVGTIGDLFTVDTRPPRPGHLSHVARLTRGLDVSSAASWSPDGRRIAFSSRSNGFAVLDLRSGRIRRYGSGRLEVPEWSPDGRWLAFVGDEMLQIVRPNGSDAHVIATIPGLENLPDGAWSADSRQLAVEAWGGDGYAVWSVNADGSGARPLTEGGRLGYSDYVDGWQPTGRTTAMLAGRVVSPAVPTDSVADGDMLRTTHPIVSLATAGDSTTIAIQYPFDGPPLFEGTIPTSCTEVWDPATGTITRFLETAGCARGPDHSSMAFDGDRLVWTSGPNHALGVDSWLAHTATLEAPVVRLVALPDGTDLSAPVGEAGLFAYESWRAPCNSFAPNCNPPPPPKRNGRLIRVDATANTAQVGASDGALTPLDVDHGRILVSRENGSFEIDSSNGTQLVSFTAGPPLVAADDTNPALQACLQGNDVVVAGGGYIAHYDATTGSLLGQFAVPAGSLAGCANGIVATAGPTTVTLTRLADGATATIDSGGIPTPDPASAGATLPLPARLDTAGLFFAWTVDDKTYPGRVAFIPTAKLPLQ
jgi:hypothetical protein